MERPDQFVQGRDRGDVELQLTNEVQGAITAKNRPHSHDGLRAKNIPRQWQCDNAKLMS